MKPPQENQQGGGLQLSTSDLLAVGKWLTSGATGVSSTYMLAVALAGEVLPTKWGDSTPSDEPDLGRCLMLIKRVPGVRNCFSILRTASPVWAAYIDHWDELATIYEGHDYAVTTGRMRDLRSSANDNSAGTAAQERPKK